MLKLTLVGVVIFAGLNVAASANISVVTNTPTANYEPPSGEGWEPSTNPRDWFTEPRKPNSTEPCLGCRMKCCGKYYVCAKNCTGYPCDEDGQCGGGCCTSGNCTAESCDKPFELTNLEVGLVAGGSALALSLACTCTCKCVRSRRRKNKKQPNVVVNMHVPPAQGNPQRNPPPEIPMGAQHTNMPQPNPPHQMPMGAHHTNMSPPNRPPGINYGYQGNYYQAR